MGFSIGSLGLYTDFYELAMAQGYLLSGKKDQRVVFDYYFRTNPFNNGFTVFAGIYDLLEFLKDFNFSDSDILYLKEQGFKDEFLNLLRTFTFKGTIFSMKEGEIVFPNEPVVRVEGNIIEAQLIESLLLNILNFETLIATKAYRIKLASGKKVFSDFGLRRAQGFGAIHASRAACIGGASFTSNVMAGKLFDIPVSGTQAHAWIQSFNTEYEAFKNYTDHFPDQSILLVDTYNTIKSGVPNAIKIAKELKQAGHRLKGIRLDSGDLAFLSKKARFMLDSAGFRDVKIYASNQLNEHVIKSLLHDQEAPIDAFGVGTELITGKGDAALDGVYKLVNIDNQPRMKVSENIEKVTLPGTKNVYRYYDNEDKFFRDGILLNDESADSVKAIFHPIYQNKSTTVENLKYELLLKKVYSDEKILIGKENPATIYSYLEKRAKRLPEEHKRIISPHLYKVGISDKLLVLKKELMSRYTDKF